MRLKEHLKVEYSIVDVSNFSFFNCSSIVEDSLASYCRSLLCFIVDLIFMRFWFIRHLCQIDISLFEYTCLQNGGLTAINCYIIRNSACSAIIRVKWFRQLWSDGVAVSVRGYVHLVGVCLIVC